MGESAILSHSYSFAAPVTHNESHEDTTIHALSQSISFGKFMSENLEWGKWSSFSHKKYVEEAAKFSRPGSVAQKKAFFEAHYKRIAEAKKAATEEQPTVTPAELLLHTLETQPPLNLQLGNDESERESIQNDSNVVVSDSKPAVVVDDSLVANELACEPVEKETSLKENDKEKKEEEDLAYEDPSIGEKKKERRSITKNRPVFRLSLEKTIPPKTVDTSTKIASLSEKRSERPITQSSEKNEEKPVHKFSFLNCFFGNAKTQDQNQSMKKRETEKRKTKKQKQRCFSLKPKTVRES